MSLSGVGRLKLVKRIRAGVNKVLSSKPIKYEKYDAGELAKDIKRARDNNQTKNYRDSIKKGYEKLGKEMPKRVDKRKQPPTGSTGIGVGY